MTKIIFDNTVSSLDRKIPANKTTNDQIENELKKLKKIDSGYFRGKSYFVDNDGTENYVVFQQYTDILK